MNVTRYVLAAWARLRSIWAPELAKRWNVRSLVIGAAAGAALAYLLDPERGRKRRHLIRDRTAAAARRGTRRITRTTHVTAARARGRTKGIVHRLQPHRVEALDDVTLAHKVESVLFRDPAVPKERISVNAEDGTVFLRGQIDRPELIHDLEEAVRKIAGVRDVENLLHLPGEPAPSHAGRRVS